MMKAYFETLTPYGNASSKQRGNSRNELEMSLNKQSCHWRESSSKQYPDYIHNEMFQRSLTASKQTLFKFKFIYVTNVEILGRTCEF